MHGIYSRFKNVVSTPARPIENDGRITFIIPTLGRPSLQTALMSLKLQTIPDWKAIVVFDGISPNIQNSDPRIEVISVPKKGRAGLVRNEGIRSTTTEWVAFLDDDDVVTSDYIERFRADSRDVDVVIFRMNHPTHPDKILPPFEHTDFYENHVGISFCMKTSLSKRDNFWFPEQKVFEDYVLLATIRDAGKRIRISNHITYLVRL